jgi:hypothetical protein
MHHVNTNHSFGGITSAEKSKWLDCEISGGIVHRRLVLRRRRSVHDSLLGNQATLQATLLLDLSPIC